MKAQIIAELQAPVQALEAALATRKGSTSLCSHSWVVVDQYGYARCFEVDENKLASLLQGSKLAFEADRFTKKDAQTLAASIGGVAMTWWKATEAELASCKSLLDLVQNR
jgi:ribonuclease HI